MAHSSSKRSAGRRAAPANSGCARWTGEAPVPTRGSQPTPVSVPLPIRHSNSLALAESACGLRGCDTVVDAKDLSVVGITEILSHLPKIYGLYRRLIDEADKRKPDLAIVIDSPAFNWRVARQMKRRGIPVVYYVAPQFWAWRQGRVRLLRDYIDKALVIFPFEEKFYSDRGVDATFVGPSTGGFAAAGNRAERLCRTISSGSGQTLDHGHARQPRQRSSHEFADDAGSGRPAWPRIRISTAGRTHARPLAS